MNSHIHKQVFPWIVAPFSNPSEHDKHHLSKMENTVCGVKAALPGQCWNCMVSDASSKTMELTERLSSIPSSIFFVRFSLITTQPNRESMRSAFEEITCANNDRRALAPMFRSEEVKTPKWAYICRRIKIHIPIFVGIIGTFNWENTYKKYYLREMHLPKTSNAEW